VLAVLFTFVAAFTVINQTYDYYPTLARLFGKEAANFVAVPQLQAIRDQVRKTRHLPSHGDTISIHIPPTKSKFEAADAYVWLPPVWFHNPEPALPVIELLDGVPGDPSDWTGPALPTRRPTPSPASTVGLPQSWSCRTRTVRRWIPSA
jgi:hypothetical protein